MHAAMTEIPTNATKYPVGLHFPKYAAITAGKPKMLAPIMVFTISATRLQRPMTRTNPFDALACSICNCAPHILKFVSLERRNSNTRARRSDDRGEGGQGIGSAAPQAADTAEGLARFSDNHTDLFFVIFRDVTLLVQRVRDGPGNPFPSAFTHTCPQTSSSRSARTACSNCSHQ